MNEMEKDRDKKKKKRIRKGKRTSVTTVRARRVHHINLLKVKKTSPAREAPVSLGNYAAE